ncbi:MAG: hypothetical protein FJ318_02200 [SAR202 cluster bacterium]|nr:hypothetical protein [SAR202 cluster bacterium]
MIIPLVAVETVRDYFLIVYLAGAILLTVGLMAVVYLLYRSVRKLMGSAQTAMSSAQEAAEEWKHVGERAAEEVVRPIGEAAALIATIGSGQLGARGARHRQHLPARPPGRAGRGCVSNAAQAA